MKEDQEQKEHGLVRTGNRGLMRTSARLIRRGLDALLKRQGKSRVRVEDTKQSDYQHPPFAEDRRKQIRLIMASLDEVSDWSLEKWEDGFRRDSNPDRELAIWIYIANVYRDYTSGRDFSLDQKEDLFRVFFACSMNLKETVMTDLNPTSISLEETEKAVQAFYG